jgi:hypothetical protein
LRGSARRWPAGSLIGPATSAALLELDSAPSEAAVERGEAVRAGGAHTSGALDSPPARTLDTKGAEYAYVGERLSAMGVATLVVDAGTGEPQGIVPDIAREDVATVAGTTSQALAARSWRWAGPAGPRSPSRPCALPVGIPKLLVSTMASGECAPTSESST